MSSILGQNTQQDKPNQVILENVVILWDYLNLEHRLEKADAILVLGSNSLTVPKYASQLYHQGFADRIIFSGNKSLRVSHDDNLFDLTEAETFAEVAMDCRVPKEAITLEKRLPILMKI